MAALRWCIPVLLSLLLPACDSSPSDPADGENVRPVLIGEAQDLHVDVAWVGGGRVEGNVLTLGVEYEGGCVDHLFELVVSPTGTDVAGTRLFTATLSHDARGDECPILVSEALRFDLRPLQSLARDVFGPDTREVGLRISAPSPPGGLCAAVPLADRCRTMATYRF